MKIFISGSEGFIGSHLTEKLLKLGHQVTALVNYNFQSNIGWLSNIKSNKKLKILHGDIRDQNFLFNALKDIDVVFNLAALIGIPYSYKAPRSYLETNVIGSFNIFEACLSNNVKQIVHTSTSEIYGNPKGLYLDENQLPNAQSPYAASKIAADQFGLSYYKSFDLPVTIIRPFNTFGPRQSLRAIVPTIICQAISSNIIELGNIEVKRDMTFIDDTVGGFVNSLDNKRSFGEIINLGAGFEISIPEIINIVERILDKKLIIKIKKNRIRPKKSEVSRLLSSNKKAKSILKWQPFYKNKKDFFKAMKITINWYQNNLENYKFIKSYNL